MSFVDVVLYHTDTNVTGLLLMRLLVVPRLANFVVSRVLLPRLFSKEIVEEAKQDFGRVVID